MTTGMASALLVAAQSELEMLKEKVHALEHADPSTPAVSAEP